MDFTKGIKPLKGAHDWPAWKDCVRDVLKYMKALDIVEGKRVRPVITDTSSVAEKNELQKFDESADKAKIVISQCVSDEIHTRISGDLTAKEAWDILTEQFDKQAEDQLFRKTLELFAMSWDENQDASTVEAKLKNHMRELEAGLATRDITTIKELIQLIYVSLALHILPKRFDVFKSSYLLLKADSPKTLAELFK